MKNKTIHGFTFINEEYIEELEATLYRAVYDKTKTELAYLKRSDKNKTFAISFKTTPTDDTGVFHILEHSVLCGSNKYRVKEPFVELLKGSLKTFLNAFTFPDKTMYPVSSRNDKDFLNLIDVYMDAVLYPLALKNKNVFYQEGWHHTVAEDGSLSYNGVVFNEMKGAYSSPDELETSEIAKMLYCGSCYGYDSGGDPKAIPNLTYEEFCDSHKKYYHPSNAKIFLDGDMKLEEVLEKISDYLKDFDEASVSDCMGQVPCEAHDEATVEYEVAEGENIEASNRICFGYHSHTYEQAERALAVSVLIDAIAGTNESPLKKAILSSGLCEDASFFPYDGIMQSSLLFEIKNYKIEDEPRLVKIYLDTVKSLVSEGIDKRALTASLSSIEFKAREQDSGGYPQGIAYAISVMSTWLYGGDPAMGLKLEKTLASLKSRLDSDYFERLLEEIILNPKVSATLRLIPGLKAAEARLAEEKKRLLREAEALTEAELEEKRREAAELETWQAKEDDKEALAALPSLSVSDIDPTPEDIPTEQTVFEGIPLIHVPANTKGITYLSLLFDISDYSPEELSLASFMTDLLSNCRTEGYSAEDLHNELKTDTGAVTFTTITAKNDGKIKAYLRTGASFLTSKSREAISLIKEILCATCFDDEDAIGKIIGQTKLAVHDGICQSGHSAALGRAGAFTDGESAINEYTEGIEYYKWIKAQDKAYKGGDRKLLSNLKSLLLKTAAKQRLTVIYSGKENEDEIKALISHFKTSGEKPEGSSIKPFDKKSEGVIIPGGVSYSAMCNSFESELPGFMAVVRSILSYGYLWGAIRVQGGAYGAGNVVRKSGLLGFYSYRDPSPYRSIECYKGSADFLRAMAEGDDDFTNFIIGAVGDSDVLLTPKNRSILAMALYLRGESYASRCERRKEMLKTSKADLVRAAELIEKACLGGFCIVGSKDIIKKEQEKLGEIIEL